jgi:hypothetical protein
MKASSLFAIDQKSDHKADDTETPCFKAQPTLSVFSTGNMNVSDKQKLTESGKNVNAIFNDMNLSHQGLSPTCASDNSWAKEQGRKKTCDMLKYEVPSKENMSVNIDVTASSEFRPFEKLDHFPHLIKKQLSSIVRRKEKLKLRKKIRKSKRKGIERSLQNGLFLDKLTSGLKFPISRFYIKNIQKMGHLSDHHLESVISLLSSIEAKKGSLVKKEKIVSESLKEKNLMIDSYDFFQDDSSEKPAPELVKPIPRRTISEDILPSPSVLSCTPESTTNMSLKFLLDATKLVSVGKFADDIYPEDSNNFKHSPDSIFKSLKVYLPVQKHSAVTPMKEFIFPSEQKFSPTDSYAPKSNLHITPEAFKHSTTTEDHFYHPIVSTSKVL